MRYVRLSFAAALAFALTACVEAPGPVEPAVQPQPAVQARGGFTWGAKQQHVFVLNAQKRIAELAAGARAEGGRLIFAMDEIGLALVSGLTDEAAQRVAARYGGEVAVDAHARWLPPMRVQHRSVKRPPRSVSPSLFRPETAVFYLAGLQWNMQITDTDDAWLQGYKGSPKVSVAILDTGIDAYHIEMLGRIDTRRSFAFVPSKTGPPVWEDDNFHGTHVSNAVTSNNFAAAGVAPDVALIAVKVLDHTGEGSMGDIIAGIYYAALVRSDVINMSLGAYLPRNKNTATLIEAFTRAVNFARARGSFVVAAAGNDARDLDRDDGMIQVPCETGSLACVSATGPSDKIAYYSNYGRTAIDVAAPGGDFLDPGRPFPDNGILGACTSRSLDPALAACVADDIGPPFGVVGLQYVFVEGTSAAAPHVSGLGAYLDSQYHGALDGATIQQRIQKNADDLGPRGRDKYYGHGRINTCRTLPGCRPQP